MREFQVMKQELQEMVHQRLDMSTELSDEAIGDVIDGKWCRFYIL